MPSWDAYCEIARTRGALAHELFVVESMPAGTTEQLQAALPEHLAYQKALEARGQLFLAGPLSDTAGTQMSGGGLIVYRAESMEAARSLAEADPLHRAGARRFVLRRWLVNEGSLALSVTLSDQRMRLQAPAAP